jgi:hypothetical protein
MSARDSWVLLPRGNGASKRDAERGVGRDHLVPDAQRSEHRAPFADDFFHCVAIRYANVGNARGHRESALGVDEQRFPARRQVPLSGVHHVKDRDVVAGGTKSSHRAFNVGEVHE